MESVSAKIRCFQLKLIVLKMTVMTLFKPFSYYTLVFNRISREKCHYPPFLYSQEKHNNL